MSEDGMTPLMVATLKGAVDVVQALINGKADITLRSKGGSTALSIAEEKHYSEIEQLLRINLNQRMLLAGGWRLGFDVGAPAGGHCSYRVVREMSFGREAKSGDRLLGKVEVEYVAKSTGEGCTSDVRAMGTIEMQVKPSGGRWEVVLYRFKECRGTGDASVWCNGYPNERGLGGDDTLFIDVSADGRQLSWIRNERGRAWTATYTRF